MGPELKPCPFCGLVEHLRTERVSRGRSLWGNIVCDNCEAKGPIVGAAPEQFQNTAAGAWNRRDVSPSAHQKELDDDMQDARLRRLSGN